MTIKFVGTYPDIKRIVTGLYTLDRSCSNDKKELGLPVGTGYELFGLTGTGKSTFAYSLSGILAQKLNGNIALSDFEGFDKSFMARVLETQGFSNDVHLAYDKQDEEQLNKFVTLIEKRCVVGIVDSVGAIAPMGEVEGEIGERNMGQRGFIMAQFSRKLLKLFRQDESKIVFMTNHWYPKLGGYGYVTPGGEVKKYILTVRIKLQRKETFPDGSYALIGTVVKNRWGYQDREFHVFVLAGMGVHQGMSALWDCVMLKLIKRTKTGLTLNKEILGKLGQFAKEAKAGATDVFNPFYTLLEEQNGKVEDKNIEQDNIEDDSAGDDDGNGVDD